MFLVWDVEQADRVNCWAFLFFKYVCMLTFAMVQNEFYMGQWYWRRVDNNYTFYCSLILEYLYILFIYFSLLYYLLLRFLYFRCPRVRAAYVTRKYSLQTRENLLKFWSRVISVLCNTIHHTIQHRIVRNLVQIIPQAQRSKALPCRRLGSSSGL